MVESVRFKGITFRRYPESPNWAERCYFVPGIADRQNGWLRLHEEIWRHANGGAVIPDGHEVHHVDFEPTNNDPSNLVCIPRAEHKDLHRERGRQRGRERGWPTAALAAAAAWHGSEEGRAWHSGHGAASWNGAEYRTSACEQCGAAFETRHRADTERFCSNNCKSAWRRASGIDDVDRTCGWCGEAFRVNRYAKSKCCSRQCAQRSRAAQRAAASL